MATPFTDDNITDYCIYVFYFSGKQIMVISSKVVVRLHLNSQQILVIILFLLRIATSDVELVQVVR